MPETLAELDGLLLTVPKHRTVRRDGIHFQGQRYLSPTLAPLVGKPVTIRYDPRDISEIRVYERDTLICVAVDQTNPNQRLSLREVESDRIVISAARELGPRKISANVINPGPIDTGWMDKETETELGPYHPLGRLGTPQDIAAVTSFLLSAEGRWISGQLLQADGGFSARF